MRWRDRRHLPRPASPRHRAPLDVSLAINGFYPPGFVGEDATGWHERRASILYLASQVRTCQQAELARVNLRRLREAMDVVMIEPVPYETVRGVGFYRQFLNTESWPEIHAIGSSRDPESLGGAGGAYSSPSSIARIISLIACSHESGSVVRPAQCAWTFRAP